MKKLGLAFLSILLVSSAAWAGPTGAVSTDRFGYTGTAVRYGSLADAQAQINPLDTVTIGNRDLSLFIVNDYADYYSDFNGIMGSWWYSTTGSAGYGNTNGNTGVGFMQIYDDDGSTDTSLDLSFDNFDGTYWTELTLSMSGQNADLANDSSRFSVYDNVNDAGIYHSYELNLTATGLQGTETAPGVIEAFNHPTGVTGSFSGVFELTENQTSPANIGFYTVDLALDMQNWAYDNEGDLDPYSFADSYFAVTPEPSSLALLALGGLLVAARRRR